MKKKLMDCTKRIVCFRDDDDEYDEAEKMPTCTQVCCWRLIKSRKDSRQFYTSLETLESFEKSKYQSFVSFMLSLNYILLYGVAIAPFILIFSSGDSEGGQEDDQNASDD